TRRATGSSPPVRSSGPATAPARGGGCARRSAEPAQVPRRRRLRAYNAAMADPLPLTQEKQGRIPEGLWLACPNCAQMLSRKQLAQNLSVCPECQYHFRVSARQRVAQLSDERTFEELDAALEPTDPLGFEDRKLYRDRVVA